MVRRYGDASAADGRQTSDGSWLHATGTISLKTSRGSRTFYLSPAVVTSAIATAFLSLAGFLVISAYLAFQDDLLSATLARQARIQQAYEDRIAALRTQVDLVTSRQLLDQQAVERRVALLAARQERLGMRAQHIRKALGYVEPVTAKTGNETTQPLKSGSGLRLGSLVGSTTPFDKSRSKIAAAASDRPAGELIASLEASLEETEAQQLAHLRKMRKTARQKALKIASILKRQGIRLPEDTAVGGPLIEMKNSNSFLDTVDALESSLASLEKVRRAARYLPHGSPAPGQKISSPFGSRRDPFTGRRAMHGGIDFRAQRGTPVRATASGTVIRAGRNGGYGKLVEIDHGGGITTRYAHLSRIGVKKGQKISRGQRIGRVGSTGRSTGPHLHYEVRRAGRVLNPIRYVRLEQKLKPYL